MCLGLHKPIATLLIAGVILGGGLSFSGLQVLQLRKEKEEIIVSPETIKTLMKRTVTTGRVFCLVDIALNPSYIPTHSIFKGPTEAAWGRSHT